MSLNENNKKECETSHKTKIIQQPTLKTSFLRLVFQFIKNFAVATRNKLLED